MSVRSLVPRRRRVLALVAVGALGVLVLSYTLFVRTRHGQRWDDLAFDGRRVEDPEVTRLTNDLLHDVTRSSLVLLTLGLVVLALARGRPRLAVAVGAAVTTSLVVTELLKHHVLTRPQLDGIAGIAGNSFPSGHATIGMALALGLVMVTPHRSRWLALLVAVAIATLFGIGVLATGWHRPSDTLAAYAVCTLSFAVVTRILMRRHASASHEFGEVEELLSAPVVAVAGVLLTAACGVALLLTLRHDDGWRAVDASGLYLAACATLVVLAAAIVVGYHQVLRGLSLDPPSTAIDRETDQVSRLDGAGPR